MASPLFNSSRETRAAQWRGSADDAREGAGDAGEWARPEAGTAFQKSFGIVGASHIDFQVGQMIALVREQVSQRRRGQWRWFSWADAAAMFAEAQKNAALLQVFINTVL